MKKSITIILGAAVLMADFGACKKDEYQPKGDYQPKGNYGNANVISGTVTISNWTYDGANKEYTATVIDNDITQKVVDAGTVMVYVYDGGVNIALPVTIYPSSSYSSTVYFAYGLQQVIISVQDSDLTQPNNPGTLTFRIVKVAPAAMQAHPEVDYKNYAEVKNAFGLQD